MIFPFTSIVLLVSGVVAAQTNRSTSVEQTHFSAEDEAVKHPVIIPDDVLAKLAQDSTINGAMEDAEPPLKQPPQSWFSASEIHLGASSEKDLIIVAEGPLLGENVVNYWIFRLLPQGPVLVLDGPAHDLIVRRTR